MKNVKKYVAFLMVMVLLATVVIVGNKLIPATAEAASYKMGDVDNDGEVTASDARLALRAAVGLENFTADQTKRADMDKDGDVTAQDARLILRTAVGLEQTTIVDEGEQPTKEPETKKPLPDTTFSREDLVNRYVICRYCGREDCQSLPKYHDGTIGFDYLCPEYDMTKDPNPDYHKVCRYCGRTDCITLQGYDPETGISPHSPEECPKYNKDIDPIYRCEYCGMKDGYGPNNCTRFLLDCYCPVCGKFVKGMTCHHCQGNTNGFNEIYDMWTGEKLTPEQIQAYYGE